MKFKPEQYSTVLQFTTQDGEAMKIGNLTSEEFFSELEEGMTRFEGKNQYKQVDDSDTETVWELMFDHLGLRLEPGEFFFVGKKKV